jgi:IS5 family transposase
LLNYAHLSKKPRQFRSFTGLEVGEFDSIYREIESRYEEYEIKRLSRKKKRERNVGAGRPFKLKLKDRLLMLLVYYRLYTTYTLAGYLFGLDQSNVCRDIKILEPLVSKCLPLPKKLYRKTRRLRTIEEIEQYFPGFKAFFDATEQEIPRPENKRRRKSYYSGKKKKHTVKKQVTVNKAGLILHQTGHEKGRKHDYAVYKDKHPVTPAQVENYADLGYKGADKDFPTVRFVLPVKKKRNRKRKLTKKQKRYNRRVARERAVVEHTIAKTKKYGIMGNKFRNNLRRYDKASNIVSGLVNFRIMRTNGMSLF